MQVNTTLPPTTDAFADGFNRTELRGASVGHAAREFESLFVSMLLKQMRQTLGEDGLFPGDSSDSLGGLFDMQMAAHISQHGGLGLAGSFERGLSGREGLGSRG